MGNDMDGDENDFETVPYKEKINLSQKVKLLSQEQLGAIVKIIQDECPEAFKEVLYYFLGIIVIKLII